MAWSYEQALAWLEDHVNLEAVLAGNAADPTLDRIRQVLALMGDPQAAAPMVHLTGTNGKGSTTRMISALLATRGLVVGTYTSPDLERVNERLARWQAHVEPAGGAVAGEAGASDDGPASAAPVAEEPISDDELAEALEAVAGLEDLLDGRLTRFEILTAAAYRWFADVAVDAAVVEVGMGGVWDATNVADGLVAVVTNVSLDHAEVLGPTLADIAREKAGIVKPGATLVLGETADDLAAVFRDTAAGRIWERGRHFGVTANQVAHGGRLVSLRTPTAEYDDLYLPVHGAHQGDNAVLAVTAVEAFFGEPVPEDLVAEALARLRLPGRMEVMGRRPLVVIDGAHNPAGARAAAATLVEAFGDRRMVLVAGMLAGRDPVEMLGSFDRDRVTLVVAAPAPSPRTLAPAEVAAAARSLGLAADEATSVPDAVARGLAATGDDDLLLVTGSLYLVGAARTVLRQGTGVNGSN